MAHDIHGPPSKSGAAEESFGNGAGGQKALTAAWVSGTPINVSQRSGVTVAIDYTKGDETTARVRVMVSKDGVTYRVAGEMGSSTNGLRPLQKGELKLTPADFDTTDKVTADYSCRGATWLRVDAMAVGGAPTGTLYAEVWGGWGL